MSESDQNQLPLVRAKLHVPRIPSDLVRRDRLMALLVASPDRPFTLVSAPAGYGKSTLVARWLGTVDVASTWFSVEESDNDVRQFLTCLIAAVRNHSKNACSTTLGLLRAPELPPLAKLNEAQHNDNKLTEILCLLALASHRQGQAGAAQEHLERALALARPGGIVLPFVEWGPIGAKAMLEMLPRSSDWLSKRIRPILSGPSAAGPSAPDVTAQPGVDALTNRELDVLGLLTRRFYHKEIAEALGISVETVKTHMKRLRGKLGVSTRREAVTKARKLGLIRIHDRST